MQRTDDQITVDIWIHDAVVISDGEEVGGYIGARYQKVEETMRGKGTPDKVKSAKGKTSHNLILFVENESSRYFIDRISPNHNESPTMEMKIMGLDKHNLQRTITGKFRICSMDGINPATVELTGKGVQIE
jgi:hypothetical protein